MQRGSFCPGARRVAGRADYKQGGALRTAGTIFKVPSTAGARADDPDVTRPAVTGSLKSAWAAVTTVRRRALARRALYSTAEGLWSFARALTRLRVLATIGVFGTLVVGVSLTRFNPGRLPHDPSRVAAGALLLAFFGVGPWLALGALGYVSVRLASALVKIVLDGAPVSHAARPRRRARSAQALVVAALLLLATLSLLALLAPSVIGLFNDLYELLRVAPPWRPRAEPVPSPPLLHLLERLRFEAGRGIGLRYNAVVTIYALSLGVLAAIMIAPPKAQRRQPFRAARLGPTLRKFATVGLIFVGYLFVLSAGVFGERVYPELSPVLGGGAGGVVRFSARDGAVLRAVPGLEFPAVLLAQDGQVVTALACVQPRDSGRYDVRAGTTPALQPHVVSVTLGDALRMEHVVAVHRDTVRDTMPRERVVPLPPGAPVRMPRAARPSDAYVSPSTAASHDSVTAQGQLDPAVCRYLRTLADSLPPLASAAAAAKTPIGPVPCAVCCCACRACTAPCGPPSRRRRRRRLRRPVPPTVPPRCPPTPPVRAGSTSPSGS